jgi:hypothetical protein
LIITRLQAFLKDGFSTSLSYDQSLYSLFQQTKTTAATTSPEEKKRKEKQILSYFIQELVKEEKAKFYSLDEEEEGEEDEEMQKLKEAEVVKGAGAFELEEALENSGRKKDLSDLSSQFPPQFVELLSYLSTSTEYSSQFYEHCYNSLIYRITRKNAVVELIDLVSLLLKYCEELLSLQGTYQKLQKEGPEANNSSEEMLLKGKELMNNYYHLLIQPINHIVIIENQENDNYHHADQHHRRDELDERYEKKLQLYLLSLYESMLGNHFNQMI